MTTVAVLVTKAGQACIWGHGSASRSVHALAASAALGAAAGVVGGRLRRPYGEVSGRREVQGKGH